MDTPTSRRGSAADSAKGLAGQEPQRSRRAFHNLTGPAARPSRWQSGCTARHPYACGAGNPVTLRLIGHRLLRAYWAEIGKRGAASAGNSAKPGRGFFRFRASFRTFAPCICPVCAYL